MMSDDKKKYVSVVIELPEDAEARSTVLNSLPLFGEFHGGRITAVYAGDAITENELFEQHVGPEIVREVRAKALQV